MIGLQHIAAVLGLGVVAFLCENRRSNYKLAAAHYNICSDKIPEEFHNKKFVFVSDLHNNQLGKDNSNLLAMIEEVNPAFVLVGGDMLVSKRENCTDQAIAFLEKIAAKYPVYCANGNHEERLLWKEEDCEEAGVIYRNYIQKIKEAGVIHLYNETTKIKIGNEYIYVSGLELEKRYYRKFKLEPMKAVDITNKIGAVKEDRFHILLAHNPAYFDTYVDWGADLTLSGHVHGGIMRLPFLGGVIAPSYEIFPKYDAGLFQKKDKKMIVNVGLGSHSIKIRLFNPPKIDVITLQTKGK